MSVLGRFRNLMNGVFGQWVKRREQRNPGAVYEAAIQARAKQYGKLREAAAGVIYMRGKLTTELQEKSAELAAVGHELGAAVDRDDDDVALPLIAHRNRLRDEVDRLRQEVDDVSAEAEAAKRNLIVFQKEISKLEDEKVRMLARWANARARARFQRTLDELSPDADIRALEEVREHIHKLTAALQVGRELDDAGLDVRLSAIRKSQADAAARGELAELKRARQQRMLPVTLGKSEPAAAVS